MQEHLLSTRILAFGTTGIRWQCLENASFGSSRKSVFTDDAELLSTVSHMQCRTTGWHETVGDAGEEDERSSVDNSKAPYEWDTQRIKYSMRSLGMVSDRLPAFSAIPRQFVGILGAEKDYPAGHW